MLGRIAWRNIWRNRKRSAILVAAISLGLWASLVLSGLMYGMVGQMVNSGIRNRVSHIQIHQPGFQSHLDVGLTIPEGDSVLAQVRKLAGVEVATGRAIISGMAATATAGHGGKLYGIDPLTEARLTDIHKQVITGDYFQSKVRNPVLIGSKMAEKLGLKIGQKLIFTAPDSAGNLSSGAFRVVGIYRSQDSGYDEMTLFALRSDVDRVFSLFGGIHEIAIWVKDFNQIDSLMTVLSRYYPQLQIQSWHEIDPVLSLAPTKTLYVTIFFSVIVLLALVFGITNTMLMSILERIREFGVLMAVGMSRRRVFGMILLEAIALSVVGGGTGMALGALTLTLLGHYGLDLSIVGTGLSSFGLSSMLYPYLPAYQYLQNGILVVLTAIFASIYPGMKAIRLSPVRAIRTY